MCYTSLDLSSRLPFALETFVSIQKPNIKALKGNLPVLRLPHALGAICEEMMLFPPKIYPWKYSSKWSIRLKEIIIESPKIWEKGQTKWIPNSGLPSIPLFGSHPSEILEFSTGHSWSVGFPACCLLVCLHQLFLIFKNFSGNSFFKRQQRSFELAKAAHF